MNISLRPATTEDEAFLYALYGDTRAEEIAAWHMDAVQAEMIMRLQFSARQQSYRYQYAVAEHSIVLGDDRPIGRVLLASSVEAYHLVDIALLGEYRGRGIGTRLLEDLLAVAEREGKPLRLHVEPFNRALRLYERLGFEKVADKGAYYLMECAGREASTAASRYIPQEEEMSEQPTQEQFREHLDTTFYVPVGPEQTLELRLMECNDLGSSAKQEQFSLIFAGPPTPMIQQQTCPLRHETMGELSLFLVPVRRDQDHIYYEAVFNYFKKQGE